MEPERIWELLQEAASSACTYERLNDIHIEFCEAAALPSSEGYSLSDKDQTAGIQLVGSSMFFEAVKKNRDLLPYSYPLFLLIYGDRKKGIFTAPIDWSLVREKLQSLRPQ